MSSNRIGAHLKRSPTTDRNYLRRKKEKRAKIAQSHQKTHTSSGAGDGECRSTARYDRTESSEQHRDAGDSVHCPAQVARARVYGIWTNLVRPELKARHLTWRHLKLRCEWARKMNWAQPQSWRRTLFIDKKRFYLGGTDGTACYWSDKYIPRATFSTKQCGGGGH